MISPGIFFIFFEIFIFWAVRGVKGQKIAQNEKRKLHLSCAISQEQYSIWSWFSYSCIKWWYLQAFFHFFEILIFLVFRGLKGQKMVQNDKKKNVRWSPYPRNHTSYNCHLCCTFVKWYYLQAFFSFFQNFDFLGC